MEQIGKNISLAAIVATLIVAAVSAYHGFVEVNLDQLEAAEVGTLFLTLIFVALVIERAVEVYINNRYGVEELQESRGIRLARQKLALEEQALAAEAARQVPAGGDATATLILEDKRDAVAEARRRVQEARDKVRSEKEAARAKLDDVSTRKAAAAGALATVLGVAASAAGVRVLGQFLPVDQASGALTGPLAAADAKFQLACFRFVDVVLTALLLAGGADGIHQIVKDFLKKKEDLTASA